MDQGTGACYNVDFAFGPEVATAAIFDACVHNAVASFCDGVSATVVACGQSASGKSHTMRGDGGAAGLVQLAVQEVFRELGARTGCHHILSASCFEVFREQALDLLAGDKAGAAAELRPGPGGLFASLSAVRATTGPEDLVACLEIGDRRRRTGESTTCERSSRSHLVFQVFLESLSAGGEARSAALSFVDLAGAEAVLDTEAASGSSGGCAGGRPRGGRPGAPRSRERGLPEGPLRNRHPRLGFGRIWCRIGSTLVLYTVPDIGAALLVPAQCQCCRQHSPSAGQYLCNTRVLPT